MASENDVLKSLYVVWEIKFFKKNILILIISLDNTTRRESRSYAYTDDMCYIESVLEIASYKIPALWPFTSHLTSQSREQDLQVIPVEVKLSISVTFCCGHLNRDSLVLVDFSEHTFSKICDD